MWNDRHGRDQREAPSCLFFRNYFVALVYWLEKMKLALWAPGNCDWLAIILTCRLQSKLFKARLYKKRIAFNVYIYSIIFNRASNSKSRMLPQSPMSRLHVVVVEVNINRQTRAPAWIFQIREAEWCDWVQACVLRSISVVFPTTTVPQGCRTKWNTVLCSQSAPAVFPQWLLTVYGQVYCGKSWITFL